MVLLYEEKYEHIQSFQAFTRSVGGGVWERLGIFNLIIPTGTVLRSPTSLLLQSLLCSFLLSSFGEDVASHHYSSRRFIPTTNTNTM